MSMGETQELIYIAKEKSENMYECARYQMQFLVMSLSHIVRIRVYDWKQKSPVRLL